MSYILTFPDLLRSTLIFLSLGYSLFPEMLQCILYYINTENTDLVQKLSKINTNLQKLVMKVLKNNEELEPITIWLKRNFMRGKVKTKEIAIEWFTELFKHYSDKLLSKEDEILSNIIQSINFKESKLTESVLRLLWLMSSKYHQFLKEIIEMLLKRFKKDKDIQMESINNLFHIMCSNIDQKLVFSEFAIEIRRFDEFEFVGFMINILDLILAGAPVYKPLRDILSKDNDDDEKKEFFRTLFETWCFNPLSTLNLWFLSKNYKLAYHLLLCIGKRISFDQGRIVQLWNIIQLIESPAFLEVRIDLLDPGKNYYLIKTLQGILMMIPISKAFTALKTRLECVSLDPKAAYLLEKAEQEGTQDDVQIEEYLKIFNNALDMVENANKVATS